jgi:hypothetical protein
MTAIPAIALALMPRAEVDAGASNCQPDYVGCLVRIVKAARIIDFRLTGRSPASTLFDPILGNLKGNPQAGVRETADTLPDTVISRDRARQAHCC